MKRRVNQFTNIEMTKLIKDGLIDFCRAITLKSQKDLIEEENLLWVNVQPSVWPNFILECDLDNDAPGKTVSQVVERMRAGEIPKEWLIEPKVLPNSALESLVNHGFTKKYSLTGMAIDLCTVNSEVNIAKDIEIKVINDKSSLDKWAEVVSVGLFKGLIEPSMFYHLLDDERTAFYLAMKGDSAIASSMLFLSSEIATIDIVATLPEYRNLGIGTAMTTLPLLNARDKGFAIGILQASEMGRSVYRKIGFSEHCTFDVMELNTLTRDV